MNKHREACPDCEMAQLRLEAYSDEIEYRDLTLRLQGLQYQVCDHCGTEIFRPEQIRANERLIAEARRRAEAPADR